MARKPRVLFEGAIYHVTVRGVERRTLFIDDADRQRFVRRLGEGVETYGVRLYLFCLMQNHVHLLVETPQANLSTFMQELQTAYAAYFNVRHHRTGHLMQGRFGAKAVEGDAYLARLSRYIHLNPVCVEPLKRLPLDARRKALRSFSWSSYPGYAGLAKPLAFVDEGPVLSQTAEAAGNPRRAYRRFVEAGLAQTDEEFLEVLRTSTWGIGDEEFQARMRDAHVDRRDRARRVEDVAFRRQVGSVGAEAILATVAAAFGHRPEQLRQRCHGSAARAVAAQMLVRFAGMSQRDVATWLRVGTGAAVSAALKRLRAAQAGDRSLLDRVADIARQLERAADTAPMRRENVDC